MNKLSFAVIAALSMAFSYAVFSFYYLSIDPNVWSMEGRGFYGFVMVSSLWIAGICSWKT